MPIDRRDADRLAVLAKLQELRTMRDEQSLSQANAKLARSETVQVKAQESLDLAKSAVGDLIGSSEFSMDELQLLQAVAQVHETDTEQASRIVTQDRASEKSSRKAWYTSRHQQDALQRGVRSAEKHLSRKKNDRAESDLRDRRPNSRKDDVS